jgi:hypothetical protein
MGVQRILSTQGPMEPRCLWICFILLLLGIATAVPDANFKMGETHNIAFTKVRRHCYLSAPSNTTPFILPLIAVHRRRLSPFSAPSRST